MHEGGKKGSDKRTELGMRELSGGEFGNMTGEELQPLGDKMLWVRGDGVVGRRLSWQR